MSRIGGDDTLVAAVFKAVVSIVAATVVFQHGCCHCGCFCGVGAVLLLSLLLLLLPLLLSIFFFVALVPEELT